MPKWRVKAEFVVEADTEDEATRQFADEFCDGVMNNQISAVRVPDDTPVTEEDR
jgi:hypothetical protein